MKFNRKKIFRGLAIVICVFLISLWFVLTQPSFSKNTPVTVSVSEEKLKSHVVFMSENETPRNEYNIKRLDEVGGYIENEFKDIGWQVERQNYKARNKEYFNVIAKLDRKIGKKVIVGAHYDSCFHTPGADDNASGVAALIELARLVITQKQDIDYEFVAYTLEEPPYFSGPMMGSAKHAKMMFENKENIVGVIVLEMVGYFSDEIFSQTYPSPLLYLYYPTRGNFITVVGNTKQFSFTKSVKIGMKGSTDLPVYSINAPLYLPGIDFSDHRNYWKYDYPAVMITDTAFYRNKMYHEKGDTANRLDYKRMGKVVLSVYNYLKLYK